MTEQAPPTHPPAAPGRPGRTGRTGRPGRVLVGGLLAVPPAALGLVVGIALVAVHQRWLPLVLGVAACTAVLTALPRRWWARPPCAVGVAVAIGLGATPRPEGDYLVGSDPQGYVLLGLAVALVLGSVLTLAGGPRRPTPPPPVGPAS